MSRHQSWHHKSLYQFNLFKIRFLLLKFWAGLNEKSKVDRFSQGSFQSSWTQCQLFSDFLRLLMIEWTDFDEFMLICYYCLFCHLKSNEQVFVDRFLNCKQNKININEQTLIKICKRYRQTYHLPLTKRQAMSEKTRSCLLQLSKKQNKLW